MIHYQYPKSENLKDGSQITIRPLRKLATILIENLMQIAADFGLEQLTAEIAPALDETYFLFEKLGFQEAAVLKDFIKDLQGNYQDLVLMVKNISLTD